ncbi:Kazal-type serine protease inhibitor domain protein [Cooperia oncophora]
MDLLFNGFSRPLGRCCELDRSCSDEKSPPVCGTDGRTYANKCALSMEDCRNSKLQLPAIRVAHIGNMRRGGNLCLFGKERCIVERTTGKNITIQKFDVCDENSCDKECPMTYKPVCASNVCDSQGDTHANPCIFRRAACLQLRKNNVTITVEYDLAWEFLNICTLKNRLSLRSITLDDIETASKELTASVKRLKQQLNTRGGGDASLLEAYQPFLEVSESSCSSLASELQELRREETSLQSFLCANSMKLEEIASITSEALAMLLDSIKKRAMVKMRSLSITPDRQQAGRERFSIQRRSLQPNRMSVEAMRDIFLEVANQ